MHQVQPPQITFRAATASDEDFLTAVYGSTREDELRQVDWTGEQKSAFVSMQFAAQHRHYHAHYRQTEFLVILCDGVPCGRLYLARWSDEFRVVELTLLPAYRNRGIGGRILQGILIEADAAGKPVRIHVEQDNPAAQLYRRHGFVPVGEHGVHILMERAASAHAALVTPATLARGATCPAC